MICNAVMLPSNLFLYKVYLLGFLYCKVLFIIYISIA